MSEIPERYQPVAAMALLDLARLVMAGVEDDAAEYIAAALKRAEQTEREFAEFLAREQDPRRITLEFETPEQAASFAQRYEGWAYQSLESGNYENARVPE